MAEKTLEEQMVGTMEVPDKDKLDDAKLSEWMGDNIPDFAGPLSITKFKGGQSNPTYKVETPTRDYVLRRKPFGKLLPSAHAIDREYRVIEKLHPAGYPVAQPFGLCEEDSLIGAHFYVMGMADGRGFWDGRLPSLDNESRTQVYHAMIDTLALLHSYDAEEVGLSDHGKPGNYCARQTSRWTKQYRLSELEPIPVMDRLMDWVNDTIPEQKYFGIVHGDYRLDNMIFKPDQNEVLAVLDWELSTLGDPIADFAYWLMAYEMAPDGRSGIAGVDHASLGIPTREEAIERYCEKAGISQLPDMNWYLAYNLFRIAAILQGIRKRVVDGTANSAQASEMADRVTPLAEAGWAAAQRAGA